MFTLINPIDVEFIGLFSPIILISVFFIFLALLLVLVIAFFIFLGRFLTAGKDVIMEQKEGKDDTDNAIGFALKNKNIRSE